MTKNNTLRSSLANLRKAIGVESDPDSYQEDDDTLPVLAGLVTEAGKIAVNTPSPEWFYNWRGPCPDGHPWAYTTDAELKLLLLVFEHLTAQCIDMRGPGAKPTSFISETNPGWKPDRQPGKENGIGLGRPVTFEV